MALNITLYGIVDPQIARGRSLAHLARAAADGGTTIIQYRAKEAVTRAMIAEARGIVAALSGTNVPLLINDRVDVALASGAQGVHLGREDMHPADARALLGSNSIIGATVKDRDDLLALRGQPVDYLCIGGVFATSHKDNPDPPLGIPGFRALRAEAREWLGHIPVGAIAGITVENAGALMEAGADGVAVIGALFAGEDPCRAAKAFLPVLRRAA
ncbi:MAG: thiamine phosphate synthase [Methylobacterium sp.]|jgi:thiamine-phosphate pyrophosphorylase|nr:thiamine phosphate synthase [Methylobacterium sp.]MCA3604486.1 thiamine phosphate synthase [Methylobacterium sp.]MCA3616110.1 thiamine phosphate synthase [Methylobacterium sp.]MCA4910608.1 thiamine phosphate synthase [Methylobacterium sp.]